MGIFPCVILVRQSLSYSSSAELGSPVSSTGQTGMLFHKFKPMFEADKNHAKEKAPSCEDGLPVRLSSGRKSRYSWLWDNRPRCTKGKPDTFKVPPTRRSTNSFFLIGHVSSPPARYWLKSLRVISVRCQPRARRKMMAAFSVARNSCGLINGLRVTFRSFAPVKHGAVAAAALQTSLLPDCRRYSVGHLSVKERIDKKRKAALVGGGQKRIDAQHKRVKSANIDCCNLNVTCTYSSMCAFIPDLKLSLTAGVVVVWTALLKGSSHV